LRDWRRKLNAELGGEKPLPSQDYGQMRESTVNVVHLKRLQ
jgi:hypothetical protein